MFTIDDLWKIISYLKNKTTDSSLSELTLTLSSSEKLTTTALFEQVLDQNTFSTDDYKRLRSFLIDWYSSHKTIASTQRFATDVHQLPNSHLSELFKSFGFPMGLDLVPLTSKANFFLDLVNFYKKKGTPETLVDVLDYYGFSDSDLVEYWLQKDQYGNLVFRGESVRQASSGSTLDEESDVSFEKMTSSDPHWFQTKEQIEALTLTNTINLPSKSPYFSLSSIFSLYSVNVSLSLLFRVVRDQYNRFISNKPLPYNIPVKNLGLIVPILHIYIASIYAFERKFGRDESTGYLSCGCYNGGVYYTGEPPVVTSLSEAAKEYENLIKSPSSKLDMDSKLEQLSAQWSIPNTDNFLTSIDSFGDLLQELNPSLKKLVDTWFNIGNQNYLITYLIGTLDYWIKLNINSKSPSLVITMLGIGFRDELDNIINFFKPYRARLAFMDTAFSIKNPLAETVLLEDYLMTDIKGTYKDFIRPLSFPIDNCLNGKIIEPPIPFPKPPGYAGVYTDYRWDMGTRFDDLPYDSMDDDYYKRLEQLILQTYNNSICDDIILSVNSSFNDKVGERIVYDDYDTGRFYDISVIKTWDEKIESTIFQSNQGNNQDIISVSEDPITSINTTISDDFGLEYPMMMDVGYNYDVMPTKSPVRDSFYIQVSSVGTAKITTSVSSLFFDFDSGKTFDYTPGLCLGKEERMSSSILCKTVVLQSLLSKGRKEVLSSRSSVKTNAVVSKVMLSFNNYYDNNKFYDVGPVTLPDPPCTCNCNYACTCNCNYTI